MTVPRIFSGTGTGTFFRGQYFSVPLLFNETNFLWYRYRYHPKSGKFPGIIWYRYQIHGNFPVPVPNFSGTDTGAYSWEQIFPVLVLVLFFGTKFPVPDLFATLCHKVKSSCSMEFWDSLYIRSVCASPNVTEALPTKVPLTNFRQESFANLDCSNTCVKIALHDQIPR